MYIIRTYTHHTHARFKNEQQIEDLLCTREQLQTANVEVNEELTRLRSDLETQKQSSKELSELKTDLETYKERARQAGELAREVLILALCMYVCMYACMHVYCACKTGWRAC